MADVPHFALETLDEVRAAGIEQLLERHYQEIAFYKDIPLEPDWDAYARIEAAGGLRIFTARVAGELIGYCAYLISRNPHYKSSQQAKQDVLFVLPKHRHARFGAHLILFSERALRAEGVQVTYQHSKASEDLDMTALLERLGYELVDTIWAKRLDRS
ncbi:MAG TPA: GNAT family N-acetyltransferase [Steroidobacteraceae bacterium]|nr:GNAT family N-acetyltransferase [Steroidobacteraceae bacterium]